jgi:hypothetical protein
MTSEIAAMKAFYGRLFGIDPSVDSADLVVFDLPSGDIVELFSPNDPDHRHFTTGPVAGFLVDDVRTAAKQLRAERVELVGSPVLEEATGVGWTHFRAPDGNVYELIQNPSHPSHRRATSPVGLPPLAEEDHVCRECAIDYPQVSPEQAVAAIAAQPGQVGSAVLGIPDQQLRQRPNPETWSILEYVCHLRDVYAATAIRLYRTRTEDRPALEPVFNDLRATGFHYNSRNLPAVLDEMADNVDGIRAEVDRVPDGGWDRQATRRPDEVRTARWLLRQAMHEGSHHLGDIAAVARRVSGAGTP